MGNYNKGNWTGKGKWRKHLLPRQFLIHNTKLRSSECDGFTSCRGNFIAFSITGSYVLVNCTLREKMALVTCCRDMAAAPLAKAVFYTIAQWCRDAAAPLAEEHRDQAPIFTLTHKLGDTYELRFHQLVQYTSTWHKMVSLYFTPTSVNKCDWTLLCPNAVQSLHLSLHCETNRSPFNFYRFREYFTSHFDT